MANRALDIVRPTAQERNSLFRRYLLWLYKMTKDDLDKIERKFTQLEIDRGVQKILEQEAVSLDAASRKDIAPHLKEWRSYIFEKENGARKMKFADNGRLDPRYLFLRMKLKAVEKTVVARFGRRVLSDFKRICEDAAVKRIREDTGGRR